MIVSNHYRIIDVEDDFIHAQGISDYTLCGLGFEGNIDHGAIAHVKKTREKINCPQCIFIINFCKSIKNNEIEKEYE